MVRVLASRTRAACRDYAVIRASNCDDDRGCTGREDSAGLGIPWSKVGPIYRPMPG